MTPVSRILKLVRYAKEPAAQLITSFSSFSSAYLPQTLIFHPQTTNIAKPKMPAGSNSSATTAAAPDHLPHKALEIKQDDKFFTRLLSKETSIANPSFRVYYGVASAGAVPFMWESQPGTPKHKLCETYIPPLTPPPSYHSKLNNNKQHSGKKSSKPNLITNTATSIFPRLAVTRRKHVSPSPSSPLSSSSWSTSSLSSPSTSNFHGRRSSSLSSLDSRVADDEEGAGAGLGSPTSTLCFGVVGREKAGEFRGCYSLAIVKNALSSIKRHGAH